jgi:hypothetical protein
MTLISEIRKPLVAHKKTMGGTGLFEIGNKKMAVPGVPIFSAVNITKTDLPSLSKIFSIKFKYLEQIYHTKALKTAHGYGDPFYKVVLSSSFNPGASICWLQRQPQGWIMLLGPDLGEGLKNAITSAIECHEAFAGLVPAIRPD